MPFTNRIKTFLNKYPPAFYILIFGLLFSSIGWGIVFPFLSVFLRFRLNASMGAVGTVIAVFSAGNIIGQYISGHLTDRVGRRPVILVTSFMHGVGMLLFIPGTTIVYYYVVGFITGLFDSSIRPAINAMVADIVPVDQRNDAYSVMRIVHNLGVVIGPAFGGFLAHRSYALLFSVAAAFLFLFFAVAAFFLGETYKPDKHEITRTEGYRVVLKDRLFMGFLLATVLVALATAQLVTVYPVYLKEIGGFDERFFGYLISLNALMVVLFQLPISSRVKRFDMMSVMFTGSVLFGLSYLFWIDAGRTLFHVLGIIIFTLGEMLVSPVQITAVSLMAPIEHRGKYMSAFSQTFSGIAMFLAPPLGGWLYDRFTGIIWPLCSIITMTGAALYLFLRTRQSYAALKQKLAEEAGL